MSESEIEGAFDIHRHNNADSIQVFKEEQILL